MELPADFLSLGRGSVRTSFSLEGGIDVGHPLTSLATSEL